MTPEMLLGLMTWALLMVTGAFVGLITWFALRVVAQLDRLQAAVLEESRISDIRLTKLEDWRTMVSPPRNISLSGTD